MIIVWAHAFEQVLLSTDHLSAELFYASNIYLGCRIHLHNNVGIYYKN